MTVNSLEMRFSPNKLKRLIARHNDTEAIDGQETLFTRELMEFIETEHRLTALILIQTFAVCEQIPDNVFCAMLYRLGHYAEHAYIHERNLIIDIATGAMVTHKSIDVRSAAIDCLGYIASYGYEASLEALRRLRAQLISESSQVLRDDIQQILDETDTNAH